MRHSRHFVQFTAALGMATAWCFALAAERMGELELDLPELNVVITLETPELETAQDELKEKRYKYLGRTADGWNVWVFVEPDSTGRLQNEGCRRLYWSRAKNNPLIDRSSVKIGREPGFSSVEYLSL